MCEEQSRGIGFNPAEIMKNLKIQIRGESIGAHRIDQRSGTVDDLGSGQIQRAPLPG